MDVKTKDVAALGRRVAAHQDTALERLARPPAADRLQAIYRKEAALSLRARAAPSPRRLGFALAATCAAASALFFAFALSRPSDPSTSLTYRVDGSPGAVGRWVAADTAQVGLDFSDGSRVDLAPGTRARVTEVGPLGAGVLLERGSLHVRVAHRDDTRWVVAGGPFEVHVIGTEFDVTWDTEAEELAVAMRAGRVRVQGPCVEPPGRAVAAPESIRLTCAAPRAAAPQAPPPAVAPTASPAAEPLAPVPSASAGPGASAGAPAPASPPSPTARAEAPSAMAAPSESWGSHLAAGELGEALAEVELLGVDAVLERAGGAELVDLGSAARLSRKPSVAARFYETARHRFAGSDAAAVAAYHLGRMAFDGRGAWAEAERWFAVYLAERPRGALAPEALGRSIECARNLKLHARARELAARYLAAYPNGAHAGLATTLAGGAD